MLKQISLRAKILLSLAALVLIVLVGGSATLWSLQRMQAVMMNVVDRHSAGVSAVGEMETALAMQRAFLAYYVQDGDPGWLDQVGSRHQAFEGGLKRVRSACTNELQRSLVSDIESKYIRYSYLRDQLTSARRLDDSANTAKLYGDLRGVLSEIYELCGRSKASFEQSISGVRNRLQASFRWIKVLGWAGMCAALVIGVALTYILISQVLEPIRRLAAVEEPGGRGSPRVLNEVKALSRRVHSLMEDVDETQTQLQLSREHLLQSEKLALVGKLAAGVAHSIRNPLTSVKMRLFSMSRTLSLSTTEKEDLDVISEEIRHIDAIVRNFLEFSRPPKLKIQSASPSDVVDMALQLLRHRLESYGVTVEVYRPRKLPEIDADPEQLKEVLVNLMVNACEAMGDGGTIAIHEEEGVTEPMGRVVVIRVSDTGPGIAEPVRESVFQPFYSTKEEGTGLGLSIARRIIEDHKGCLSLRSRQGRGATFILTLPCKEDGAWLRS